MSTRTSRADTNHFSISRNVAYYAVGQEVAIPVPPVFRPDRPLDYDAVLKVCDETTGVYLLGLQVAQGRENAIDCNNGTHHCAFDGIIGIGGGTGEQVITTKGGCHDLLYRGTMASRGQRADVAVGNWSDQSHDASYNLDYSGLVHADGAPIRFVFGRVKHPFLALFGKAPDVKLPPGAQVLFWYSLGAMAYWWGKWALVKLGVIG